MKLDQLEMFTNLISDIKPEKPYYLAYCRKSSEGEERQIQSIEDQQKAIQDMQLRKGLVILETFSEARSAKMPGRIEFDAMVEMIHKRNDIKGIVCWKLNRLSRNPKDEGTIRWLLQSGKIEEIITNERTYKMVDSDFTMAIEGSQAQRFITDLKKDTARGIQSKLDRGIAPILAPPGYINSVEKRQGEKDIQPHPVYFSLMRQIFDLALTGNYSIEDLHKKVKELKIKNSRDQIVSRTQLYKIIKDPFYTGTRFMYAGRLYTNGIHKPMITDEEFDMIQEIISNRSRPRVKTYDGFLNGIMTCGECNSPITFERHMKKYKNGKTQDFYYYRCTKKNKEIKCSQPYIPIDKLEEQAMTYLKSIKLSSRFVEWGKKWLTIMHNKQQEAKEARLKQTHKDYLEVDKKIENLVDLMISGIVRPEEGATKKQKLEEEKKRLFSVLSHIDELSTEWTNLAIQTLDFVKTAQNKFENGTIDQKKTILKVIGSNLIVKDRKLTITVRTPFEHCQRVVAEIEGKKELLEPLKMSDITSQTDLLGSINPVVGG